MPNSPKVSNGLAMRKMGVMEYQTQINVDRKETQILRAYIPGAARL